MIELPVIDSGSTGEDQPGERYWRSVADLKNDPELRKATAQEFMDGASDRPSGATRRQFLQLMGASMALAGLSACRRPVEQTLPYTVQPEEVIPGEPLFYATAMPFRGIVRPLIAESHEGRPTKIEGNPQHPMSRGAAGVFEQASVLTLYDPDRSDRVLRDGVEATWRDFLDFARRFAAGSNARRLVVMAEPTSSPAIASLRAQLEAQYPQIRWITYRPEGDDFELQGLQQLAGRPVRPLYHFSQAQVIVSLDGDFLAPTEPNFLYNTSEFARSRRLNTPDDEMSRLYVAESNFSLAGAMSDNRRRYRAGDIPAVANALAAALGLGGPSAGPFGGDPFIQAAAEDLLRAGQNGVVVVGDTQPPAVHALAASINSALGAAGTTVSYLDIEQEPEPPQAQALADLVEDMRAGQVDALLMLGVNPVYSAPAELGFEEALRAVDASIHVGLHLDETGQASQWHLPRTHYLEAWGDGRACDGTRSVIQPLIAPLYDAAHSDLEVLNAMLGGSDVSGYDLVRNEWSNYITGDFEDGWRRVLHDGFLPDTGYSEAAIGLSTGTPAPVTQVPEDAFELVFHLDPTVLDGTFANNAWAMELPDPTTKIVWDNVALISPATAERLGVEAEYHKGQYIVNVVEITVDGRSVRLPAWIQPGLADNSVHLTFGYGREIETTRPPREARFFDLDTYTDIYADGPLANGVGVNVAPLRSAAMERVMSGAQVSVTDEHYTISTTQEHGSMEGRPLVRRATMDVYREQPGFANAMVPPIGEVESWQEFPTLWEDEHPSKQPPYQNSRFNQNEWGMVIDLNTCTGCNSCVVACDSENNIQMVGKDEVGRGRELHWLRIDRYFVSGDGADLDEPEMVFQPIPCMHCENAPCESVCPVAATVHSADGTNQMIYNRCIGTRYCSNNCPYKVRRFNFFNWSKTIPTTVQMVQNPNVTVRFRGVMEKCSYCIQRVRATQRKANVEERMIEDGEVQTACQQACPAEAITFGDLRNRNSAVATLKRNPRNYELLGELGVRPRTTYLARVTNPNERLKSAAVPAEESGS